MASFVQARYPVQQPALPSIRREAARADAQDLSYGFDSTRGLSAMLLAAMASALVVVANQLMDTWADGHLLVAWVALWLVGFAALAVFAGAARRLAVTAVQALGAWSQRLSRNRSDEQMWALAKTDARVMADLNAAMWRNANW